MAPKPQTASLPGAGRRIKVQTIQFGNDLCETVDVSKRDDCPFEAKIVLAPTQLMKTIIPKPRVTTANDTATIARPWTKGESVTSSFKNVTMKPRMKLMRERAEVSVQNYPIEQTSRSRSRHLTMLVSIPLTWINELTNLLATDEEY